MKAITLLSGLFCTVSTSYTGLVIWLLSEFEMKNDFVPIIFSLVAKKMLFI